MHTTIGNRGDVTIFHLMGDFDGGKDCVHSTQQFKELLDSGVRKIVLDFKLVRWISSNGIGCLIAGKQLADAAGARMALCNLNERSLSVFYISQLEGSIDCVPDLDAALKAVGGEPRAMAENEGARKAPDEQDLRDQI